MKKIMFPFLLCCAATGNAQNIPVPSYWQGEIPSHKKLVIGFRLFKDSTGAFGAAMDSPGEGTMGIQCNEALQRGDSIFIRVNAVKGLFEGKQNPGDSVITGRWKQGTVIVPMQLKRIVLPVQYGKIKTQTPVSPLPYLSEEVEFDNADSLVHFGATITRPVQEEMIPTEKTYPALILISGSGQQDRDGNIMGHKQFLVIADYLTRAGFLVMRVDDRGRGKTRGDLKNATSADFAKDVETSLNFLLKRKDVNKKQIGLLGHSEGGMIAPMVAVNRKEISFLVLLAAPGYAISELMADQNEALFRQSGYSAESAARYRTFYAKLVRAIATAGADSIAMQNGVQLFKEWQQTEEEAIVTSITGVPQTNTPEKFVKPFVSQLNGAWFKFFMNYDPQPNLKRLNIPVLALNGNSDIQVLPRSLNAIKEALQQSGSKKYQVEIIPGLNHLFQQCYYCVVAEYAQLQESFSPVALKKIADWLKQIAK